MGEDDHNLLLVALSLRYQISLTREDCHLTIAICVRSGRQLVRFIA